MDLGWPQALERMERALQDVRRAGASKPDQRGEGCSPGREKRVAPSNSTLTGTVCSLERVRSAGPGEMARLAVIQHGCAHREQLLLAGLGRSAIAHRLKTHRYVLLHRAVYLIDPARADDWTPATAVVLRFAGDALLSGCSAGALWRLLEDLPACPEVTLVGRSSHPVAGVKLRRVSGLDRRDIAWRQGLPVTSVARTIVDLAGVLSALELENAIVAALHLRLTRIGEIQAALDRAPGSRGVATLRRLLGQGGYARTRSAYERKLLEMIIRAGLPRPLTNYRISGHEVDMCWPDRRLVLEFDGFKFHGDRRAFEQDRRRDQDLAAAGYRVIRVTARQVEEEPLALIARLAMALMA